MTAVLWIAALAGAALAAFVLAELAARAWLPGRAPYFVWQPFARRRLELEPGVLPSLPAVARWEINAAGERGAALPDDWGGACRVLVSGGSAAECYFLDQECTWPEVIARELNTPHARAELGVERVHVGNVARSLVSCSHVERMLARTLPRYERLDVLVLMVGASDVVNWLEKGAPPTPGDEPIPPAQVFEWHPEPPFGWTARTLALRRVASYWNKRLRRPVETRERAGKRLAEARAMRQRAPTMLTRAPEPTAMLERFELHLRRLVELGRARGARVILARQPWLEKELTPEEDQLLWNFCFGKPYTQEVKTYYAPRACWELLRRVDERAARVARELGVEEVVLNDVVPRDFEHYYDELHHTPKGCELVGKAVARKIREGVGRGVKASAERSRAAGA
jgi:hypothetical protein